MTAAARHEELARPYALPPDVRIVPVGELDETVQRRLDAREGDVVVARPGHRQRTQLLDGDTVALLEEFREPAPLAEGIARFATQRGLDPEEVLRDAFATLQALTSASLLVRTDSPSFDAVDATYAPGDRAFGYRVERLVRALEDTEVYVAAAGEDTVALKVARGEGSPAPLLAFAREAQILELLRVDGPRRDAGDGDAAHEDLGAGDAAHEHLGAGGAAQRDIAPRLIGADLTRERAHLATSWVPGVSASTRAAELRRGWSPTWRQQLHTVGGRILEVYARLHARGVVHGDVHAPNVLVDADDQVTLLDFGLSRVPGADALLDHHERTGAGWNTEPEAAAATLRGEPVPPATPAGDQYAVATLLYTMICGEHPVGSATTRDELVRQLVEQEPLPFTRHGVGSWPAVEAVLARALAKDPAARFDDLDAFHAAFVAAAPPPERDGTAGPGDARLREAVESIVEVLADPVRRPVELLPEPPRSSVQFGGAGIALFLTRLGIAEERPDVVAAADRWSRVASAGFGSDEAFDAPAVGVGIDRVGPGSLYHRAPGVHLVAAQVAHVRGDLGGTVEHAKGFAATLDQPPGPLDTPELAFGRAGLLVGGATLLELLRSTPRLDDTVLVEPLRAAAERALTTLSSGAPQTVSAPTPHDRPAEPATGIAGRRHLGVAHGVAGELYAQLWVRRLLGLPVPELVAEALASLAACAQLDGRGRSWPGTWASVPGEGSTPDHAPGWCAGTAGHVHLWCAAHDATGDPHHLELAEAAGQHCWEHADRSGHLCCGTGGRSYALLRLHQQTGDERWRERAEDLADSALGWAAHEFSRGDRPLSLYRGALGPVLLAVESRTPELAAMPVFASEHWRRAEGS